MKIKHAVNSKHLANCIPPLLELLGWSGDKRHIFESQPHLLNEMDVNGFMNTMANLGFTTRTAKSNLDALHENLLPCLFVSHDGEPVVLVTQNGNKYLAYDGAQARYSEVEIDHERGDFYFFQSKSDQGYNLLLAQKNWFLRMLLRFKSLIGITLFLSLILSITAVATPLVVMGIYDTILTADSIDSLNLLWIGIAIYLIAEVVFMWLRYRLLNYSGTRIGYLVNNQVMRRILYLPPAFTGNSTIGTQVSRIQDFTSIQNFIGGQGILSIIDLPFILVLVLVMMLLSGNLVIIPLVMMGAIFLFSLLTIPLIRRINEVSSLATTKRNEFTIELLSRFRELRLAGASKSWKERYRKISADAIIGSYKTTQINTVINNVGQGLVTTAGAITIGVGVIKVLDGSLGAGGLMASMMIVWRILAPVKTAFSVFSQSIRIKKSADQLDRLMSIELEKSFNRETDVALDLKGLIRFQNVSIRYSQDAAPALLGIELTIDKGEMVALTGHDGAGKSTMLKLMLGMYKPQSGRILLDRFNIQQLETTQVRRSIGYCPTVDDHFFGTIFQNFRLVDPTLTDDEIMKVVEQVGMTETLKELPNGLNSKIGDQISKRMSGLLSRQISIVRALLNNPPILLLDEPEHGLTSKDLVGFGKLLQSLKHNKTIILVTQNKQLLKLADRVVMMEEGKIADIKSPRKPVK